MRYLFLLFAVGFISHEGLAQQLDFQWESCTSCTTVDYPVYNTTPIDMTSYDITEDYGRRESGSRWHNGLDVNGAIGTGERGYHIKSITEGTVVKIFRSGYKVLAIDGPGNQNFAYGHIFMDSQNYPYRLGDMVLTSFTSGGVSYGAIIYDPSNSSSGYCLTDAPLNGSESDANFVVTYKRPDGATITYSTANGNLSNQVRRGDIIAPMGGSGGFENADHVHLYNFSGNLTNISDFQEADNLHNPLIFLDHRQPVLTNTIQEIRINDNGNAVVGAGPFYGMLDIKARVSFPTQKDPSVNRYTATSPIFNLNKVELWIKPNNELELPSLLKGAHFEAKIDYGGRWTAPGNTRYPTFNTPPGNTVGGDNTGLNPSTGVDIAQTKTASAFSADWGDFQKTGISGNAYTTYLTADSYDEFYFNDYHTRIHMGDNFGKLSPMLAMRSVDARYPDGPYQLSVKSQTVRDVNYEMATPRGIVIDNFKPFVEMVKVSTQAPDPIFARVGYNRQWVWNNGTNRQVLGENQATQDLYQGQALRVEIHASEPMQSMTITIASMNVTNHEMQSVVGGYTWFYDIPTSSIVQGSHVMTFTGTDYAGNALIESPGQIPYRADNGTWSTTPASGQDRNHAFYIEPGTCPNPGGRVAATCDVVADYTYNISSSDPLQVTFTDTSAPTGSVTSWLWNFGDASSGSSNTSTVKNPSHRFSASGTYTVSLTATDGVTTDVHTKQIIVDNTPVSVSFSTSSTVGNAPFSVQLAGTTNVSDVSAWEWSVSPSSGYTFSPNATSQNTSVRFTCTGAYTVRLRIVRRGTTYTSSAQTIQVNSSQNPVPQFSWSGSAYAYTPILLRDQSFVSASCSPGTSTWTITDQWGRETTAQTAIGAGYIFYPIEVGTYQVKLCLLDECGQSVCTTKSLNVTTFENSIQPNFIASSISIRRGQTIEYRDLTSDPDNKINHWGWWVEHKPGTSWGHCERCYERGDNYTGVETKQYTVPGTYEVRLLVHEDIGYTGLSKTMTIEVLDNIVYESYQQELINPVDGVQLYGDYAAVMTSQIVHVMKRSGNTWNTVAQLRPNTNVRSQAGLSMYDNVIAMRAADGVYIWEKPATGEWVDTRVPTQFIPAANAVTLVGSIIDLKHNTLAVIRELSRDGAGSYLDIYERGTSGWPTTPTQRLNIGYGANASFSVVVNNNTIVVKQSNLNNASYKTRLAIFEKSGATWQQVATLSGKDNYFAGGFDISGDAIVAVNQNVSRTDAPPRESYVYVRPGGGWQTNASPTAVLSLEFPEPISNTTSVAEMDGDNIVVKLGKQLVAYRKQYNGWQNMTETMRLRKSNHAAEDWPSITFDVSSEHVLVGTFLDQQHRSYFFEIVPKLCDDPETLGSFDIPAGESISNSKGVLTIGGSGAAVIRSGATGSFRGTRIEIKPGFSANQGSKVSIKATACDF